GRQGRGGARLLRRARPLAGRRVRIWVAGPGDADDVTRLMVDFRDWTGRDWPDRDAFARGVERLLADENTEFLLAAGDDGSAAAGVCQLRYRYGLWWDAPDCL